MTCVLYHIPHPISNVPVFYQHCELRHRRTSAKSAYHNNFSSFTIIWLISSFSQFRSLSFNDRFNMNHFWVKSSEAYFAVAMPICSSNIAATKYSALFQWCGVRCNRRWWNFRWEIYQKIGNKKSINTCNKSTNNLLFSISQVYETFTS